MSSHLLNTQALYERLDQVRRDAEMSWRGVAKDVGIQSSTLTRIKCGHAPSAHALVSLLIWLEMDSGLSSLITSRED